jgi:hypothetical protein
VRSTDKACGLDESIDSYFKRRGGYKLHTNDVSLYVICGCIRTWKDIGVHSVYVYILKKREHAMHLVVCVGGGHYLPSARARGPHANANAAYRDTQHRQVLKSPPARAHSPTPPHGLRGGKNAQCSACAVRVQCVVQCVCSVVLGG